jgi:type IV pilus biogenesis protein CpaD/CtpE
MSNPRCCRRGSIVSEALAAVALATVTVGGIAQLVAVAARQWNSAQQRAVAVREAGNALESLLARPDAELTATQPPTVELLEEARRILPASQLHVTVAKGSAASEGIHVHVRVDWQSSAGQPARPVHVTAWKFPLPETSP